MSAQDRLGAALAEADARAHSSVTAAEPGRALKTASRWWIGGGVGLIAIIALGTAAAILTESFCLRSLRNPRALPARRTKRCKPTTSG